MKNLRTVAEQAPKLAQSIIVDLKSGKRNQGIEWGESLTEGKVTIKEMIGTDDGASEFVEKVTYDLYSGRETVNLLYKEIYTTLVDANFPQTMTVTEFGPVQVVFLQKMEGGEVKFGTIGAGTTKVVTIVTYAAGIEYDEDILEFNQTWRLTEIGLGMGEAYNKLLNHVHLSPIIGGSYVTTGGGLSGQKTAQKAGTAQLIAFDTNIATTLRNAMSVLPRGVKMLINTADRFAVEDAIASSMYADATPSLVKQRLQTINIIEYDGDEVVVGGKTYTYAGVTAGFMYLIVPKRNFREYVKHDLRVDSSDGDLSRLILAQVVARTRRGVLATLGTQYGVVKVDLYT